MNVGPPETYSRKKREKLGTERPLTVGLRVFYLIGGWVVWRLGKEGNVKEHKIAGALLALTFLATVHCTVAQVTTTGQLVATNRDSLRLNCRDLD